MSDTGIPVCHSPCRFGTLARTMNKYWSFRHEELRLTARINLHLIGFVLILISQQCTSSELPLGLGGSISWTSDYVFRGVSQSQNLPAIQAEVHVQPVEHWVVGAWASTLHLLPSTHSTEINPYVGHQWTINQDWNLNITGTHYQYLNDPRSVSYNYDELSLSTQWADTIFARVAWSPNTNLYQYSGYRYYENQQTLTIEGGYHAPLPWKLDAQIGAGLYLPLELHQGRYAYGSAGITRQFGSIQLELNYFWVQSKEHRIFNQWNAGTPWVVAVQWQF